MVISPLKALMNDQVAYLKGQNIQADALMEETLLKGNCINEVHVDSFVLQALSQVLYI